MTDLTKLTMTDALGGLAKGEFTSVELTEAHVRAVEASRALNAFITETPEQALAMAERADAQRAKGEAGPLNGLPLAIKDLFCTAGFQTTAGSHILEGFKPPYEFDRHRQSVARRCGHARQDQPGRVRHGLVQRDQLFRPRNQPLEPWRPGPARRR